MSSSTSRDPSVTPPASHASSAEPPPRPALTLVAVVVAVGAFAYGRALALPAWETDTWFLNLLAQKALHARSWTEAYSAIRFVLDNPKGWSDGFILASWFLVYRVAGPSIVAFHAVGIACHLASAALLGQLSTRWSGSVRVGLWTAITFTLLPLCHDVVAVEAHSQYPLFGSEFLATWLLLERWRDRGSVLALVGAWALYVLALGTKELAFAMPPLLLVEVLRPRGPRGVADPLRTRRWVALASTTCLAAPFLLRPFWVAHFDPARATSPADALMMRDLLRFLAPGELVPKLVLDLARWSFVPFASERQAARWLAANAAISVTAVVVGAACAAKDRSVTRWRVARPLLWMLLGYLPVGFQLDRSSFEKTGELYLAAMGMALGWGELLGSGASLRRVRTFLGAALAAAMLAHLQLLSEAMGVHGERVQAAVRDLAAELASDHDERVVIVGEERLDRGAIDAVVLQLAYQLGKLPAPLTWIGGGGVMRPIEACPADATTFDATRLRFLGWNDARQRFDRLTDRAALERALAWKNPDPEQVWIRDVCLAWPGETRLLTTEVLSDLSPETILFRL